MTSSVINFDKKYPLVSIVMPTLNQLRFIRKSIHSVLSQDYNFIELIVFDAGSTDGTLDFLNEISKTDRRLKWKSEPDFGPADALNKAFKICRGEIIGWLNSDDLYAPGAVNRAVTEFKSHPDWIMLYGHAEHIDVDGHLIDFYKTKEPNERPLKEFADGCFICQPTVFFKSTFLILQGKLNVNLKTAFDFDYWIRAFRSFPNRIGFVDHVQAQSRLHKDCITFSQRKLVFIESMGLIVKYIGDPPVHWLITYVDELHKGRSLLSLGELKSELIGILNAISPQPSHTGIQKFMQLINQLK
ncbi:MAG TPA: glycosyltransferase [Bacteroidetes bacterium]|nr:glycosyltransferase [Bacteroidota bacterium]